MIDYIVMRAGQRKLCTDVQVMRGATCWSDHHMIRGKVRIELSLPKKSRATALPIAVHTFSDPDQRSTYREKLDESLSEQPHSPGNSAEEGWNTLKECTISTAEAVVGRGKKKQPDWFSDGADTLLPLLSAKEHAHNRVLQVNSITNRKEFRKHQRAVKRAVDEAKERWILRVEREAESARKDGKQRWMNIRQLQMAYAGRRPIRPTALLKENGEMTCCTDEVKLRWFNNFSNVLNIPSQFKEEVISEIPARPTELSLDDPPSYDELMQALGKLKRGKAGGKTWILPELLLYGGAEVHERFLQIFQKAWDKGEVVKDWKDAEIVPIPKKGNLKHCDNWRGMSRCRRESVCEDPAGATTGNHGESPPRLTVRL